VNNQFCMKPNFQTYLKWLLVSLFRNVFSGRCVVRVSTNKSSKYSNDFVMPFQLVFLHLRPTACSALVRRTVLSFSVARNLYPSLRFRFRPILFTSRLQQTRIVRKKQAASHLVIHRLIQFSTHTCDLKNFAYKYSLI
jgi:hypothetical protein